MHERARRPRAAIAFWWRRYEGPTWVVAAIVYGSWTLLVCFHAVFPWWLMIPLGACVVALHNSLQHETIHALANVPRPLRFALAFPPLSLAVPFPVYRGSHRRHHRDAWLTTPGEDPESYYHPENVWRNYSPAVRLIFLINQTLLGRLTIGPLLCLGIFFKREALRALGGDRSNLAAWLWHAGAVAVVLFFVGAVARMSLWQYVLLVVYPGLCLGMLRSFFEHRFDDRIGHRTAIVESGFPFNLLFLNNNLHLIHHRSPALPWYRIPLVWRTSRAELLEENGGFYFRSYLHIAAGHAFRPTFVPAQPAAGAAPATDGLRARPAAAL